MTSDEATGWHVQVPMSASPHAELGVNDNVHRTPRVEGLMNAILRHRGDERK